MPVSAVVVQELPVAEAYCTVQPVTFTDEVPKLNNSMKSFVYVAPELPPPP